MSVPENQRKPNKFTVLEKANYLAKYTISITVNKNVFLEKYQNALTDDIIRISKDIFIHCWTANNINVKTNEQKIDRTNLQSKAILECNNLLAIIELSKSVFHLDSKRVKYWGGLVIQVRELIKTWRINDIKRYKDI